jgi:hypothetical protein
MAYKKSTRTTFILVTPITGQLKVRRNIPEFRIR